MLLRIGLLALTISVLSSATLAQTFSTPGLAAEAVVSGLNQPTQIRFLSDNDMFITEKATGKIIRSNNGVMSAVLDLNVANNVERGLLGLTLDPNFTTNHYVYAYYSAAVGADGGTWTDDRLSRFTWDGTSLSDEKIVHVTATSKDKVSSGFNHHGGPIMFGPDGKLYGVVGDLARNGAEQNNTTIPTTSLSAGGIYRLNADGSIPTDNPFASSPTAGFQQWYSYGVRNSYGMAFDPVTGKLWDTENGPNVYDEINQVSAGANSGWSKVMGPIARGTTTTSDLVNLPGSFYNDPKLSLLNPIGITGLTFLAGTSLDNSFHDAMIFGDNNNGNVYLLHLNAARDGFVLNGNLSDMVVDNVAERNSIKIGTGFGVITDIQVSPGGSVYVTSFGQGKIFRIGLSVPEPNPLSLVMCALPVLVLVIRRRKPIPIKVRRN